MLCAQCLPSATIVLMITKLCLMPVNPNAQWFYLAIVVFLSDNAWRRVPVTCYLETIRCAMLILTYIFICSSRAGLPATLIFDKAGTNLSDKSITRPAISTNSTQALSTHCLWHSVWVCLWMRVLAANQRQNQCVVYFMTKWFARNLGDYRTSFNVICSRCWASICH